MPKTILDNGGETIDRYTVIINEDVYNMSDNPLSPNGVNQYAGDIDYLGWSSVEEFIEHCEDNGNTLISLDDVNDDVSKAIGNRILEDM